MFWKVLPLPYNQGSGICPEQSSPDPSPVLLTKGLVRGGPAGQVSKEVTDRMAAGYTSLQQLFCLAYSDTSFELGPYIKSVTFHQKDKMHTGRKENGIHTRPVFL